MWSVDCSEVKKMEIANLSDTLEKELEELLNSEEVSNERLNVLLNKLRDQFSV